MQRMVGGTSAKVDASLERMADYLERRRVSATISWRLRATVGSTAQSVSPGFLWREVADDVTIPREIQWRSCPRTRS